MAIRIPTPETAGLGNIQRASGAVGALTAQQGVNDFNARQVSQLAQTVGRIGQELHDRKQETMLLEAQAEWNDKRAEWMDPNTGIFARRNGDAVGAAEEMRALSERFAQEMQQKYSGLDNDSTNALSRFLEGEQANLFERAANHELTESRRYEDAMLEAAINNEANRAASSIGTPGGDREIQASLIKADGLIDSWLQNKGIDPTSALGESLRRGKMTEHILGVAEAEAQLDPEGAEALVRAAMEDMDASRAQSWLAQNRPRVVARRAADAVNTARAIDEGSIAASGDTAIPHGTEITMNLGPLRPLQPNQEILNVVGTAVADVLGPGGRVEVFSGRDDDPRRGKSASPRHYSGNAVDVRFFRPDGSQVRLGDPEFRQIALAAANRGALGIGFGREYMGDAMHIDMFDWTVDPGRFGPVWGSAGDAMEGQIVQAMRAAEGLQRAKSGIEYIESIEDPVVRAEAMQQYSTAQNYRHRAMDQHSQQIAIELQNEIDRRAAAGEEIDVNAIIEPYRGQLGARVESVRDYGLAVAAGDTIQTDPTLFNSLARMANGSAEERREFANTPIRANFAGELSGDAIAELEAMQRGLLRDLNPDEVPTEGQLQFYSHDQIMDIIQPQLNLVDSDKRAELSTELYRALENYQQTVFAGTKQRPSRRELELEARRLSRSKVPQFNPSGWQLTAGRDQDFLKVLERADEGSLTDLIQVDDLVLSYDIGGQTVNHRVTSDEIEQAIAKWRSVYRVDPLPSQVIQLMQQYPPRREDLNIVR